ncbi:MAG: hypothetical protein QHC65_18020 [Sphingomonas sp.]|nr:hypothetical protein [Sphingomonas sp.]MDX3886322.1 hypothetical protein [Sphingomonas sp.]
MTLQPLDFRFALTTPPRDMGTDKDPLRLSVRPLHTIPLDEMLAELRHESARRHDLYPRWIQAGRIGRDEANHHIALLEQILDDMTEADPAAGWPARDQFRRMKQERRSRSPFTWDQKVRELRREIDVRRNAWPSQIAGGRRPVIEARASMERMEAIHWRYWIRCDHWDAPPNGDRQPLRDHLAAIDQFMADALRRGNAPATAHLSQDERTWLLANIPPAKEAA